MREKVPAYCWQCVWRSDWCRLLLSSTIIAKHSEARLLEFGVYIGSGWQLPPIKLLGKACRQSVICPFRLKGNVSAEGKRTFCGGVSKASDGFGQSFFDLTSARVTGGRLSSQLNTPFFERLCRGFTQSAVSTIETWLILPVVICLSQRLSHACLSISNLYCETANGSLNQLQFI